MDLKKNLQFETLKIINKDNQKIKPIFLMESFSLILLRNESLTIYIQISMKN